MFLHEQSVVITKSITDYRLLRPKWVHTAFQKMAKDAQMSKLGLMTNCKGKGFPILDTERWARS